MKRGRPAPRPGEGLLRYFKPLNVAPMESTVNGDPVALEAEESAQNEARDIEISTVNASAKATASSDVKQPTETLGTEDATVSEYERKRLARMAQNAQFLQQLGVKQAQNNVLSSVRARAKPTVKPSKPTKRAREEGSESVPVKRRSRRLAGVKEEMELKPKSAEVDGEGHAEVETETLFDDSSVLRYTCSSSSSRAMGVSSSSPGGGNRSLVGFRQRDSPAAAYEDALLKRIYAITFSPFQENALIATGGHLGHVSVYPSVACERDDAQVTAPLMSFRAHRGWISCLSLQRSTANGANLLLSAANDGVVKLWDLNQSAAGVPKELMASTELHRSGIFGMDIRGDQVVTCSKDSTIALSIFGEGGVELNVQHRYEDHAGVVKSVRFSPLSVTAFASGGNDRVVRVYDSRSNDLRASQEIQDAHSRAINSVNWHPTQEHLLLTASFDPEMHLYDLRQLSQPVVVMKTMQTSAGAGQAIFHPCFVAQGDFVVSTGATSQDKLSLHRTSDGTTVSVGELPSKASFLAVDPFADRLIVATSASLQSYDFEWQQEV